jgi:hypothetical protein
VHSPQYQVLSCWDRPTWTRLGRLGLDAGPWPSVRIEEIVVVIVTVCDRLAGWPDWANFRPLGDSLLWVFFCENDRNSTNNWSTFFHCKSCPLIFKKNGLGYILGDFFTNASGHRAG